MRAGLRVYPYGPDPDHAGVGMEQEFMASGFPNCAGVMAGVILALLLVVGVGAPSPASDRVIEAVVAQNTLEQAPCVQIRYASAPFTVCEFHAGTDDIALILNNDRGDRLGFFRVAQDHLEARGRRLVFAMNAGMFSPDRLPIGLYVEEGVTLKALNRREGPGNFHMLPNGVFWLDPSADTRAGVSETQRFHTSAHEPEFATQSGPMLVIDGALHPRFNAGSTSRHIRNGVGVEGERVVFAISDEPVNFHTFASLFRDHLRTPNALYLDGAISRLYAPNLDRSDSGLPLGPMVVVTTPNPE